jgi:hypothetical protein
MLYAKVLGKDVVVFPYNKINLKKENPFSKYDNRYTISEWYKQTEEGLNTNYSVVEVEISSSPEYDNLTHYIALKDSPLFIENSLVIEWDILEIQNITENSFAAGVGAGS